MPLGLTFGDNRPPASKSARQLVGADESRGQPVRRCRHPRTDASRYDTFGFRGKPHVSALTRRTLLSSVGPSGDRRRPCNEPAMPLSPTAPHRTINMPGYVPTRPVPRSSRCHHRDCRDASTWLMTRSSNSSIYPDDLDLASYRSDTTGNSRVAPQAVGASAEIGVMAPSSESARFRKKACHRRRSCRHEDGLTKAEEKSCRRRTTIDAARDHRTHRASARKTWCPAPCGGRGIGTSARFEHVSISASTTAMSPSSQQPSTAMRGTSPFRRRIAGTGRPAIPDRTFRRPADALSTQKLAKRFDLVSTPQTVVTHGPRDLRPDARRRRCRRATCRSCSWARKTDSRKEKRPRSTAPMLPPTRHAWCTRQRTRRRPIVPRTHRSEYYPGESKLTLLRTVAGQRTVTGTEVSVLCHTGCPRDQTTERRLQLPSGVATGTAHIPLRTVPPASDLDRAGESPKTPCRIGFGR